MTLDLAREARFALGALEVRPPTREVVVGGQSQVIEPRVMQVLVVLARRRGEVVSRDELIELCWEGRIVGDGAITRCIHAIRRLAEGRRCFAVETVARVGYRLSEAGAADPVEDPASPVLPPPSKPSIAVMPFANLSGDPEQEYFADGMVVEIITALSRFPSLFVIASSSTLTYRGAQAGRARIARELGVRYLLKGSVRKAGERVRITVQLIEASDDGQLWAERFDGTLEDVFALQDTVANAVASQIEPTIEVAEIRRANARPTQDLDAHDLYLRAQPFLQRYDKEALDHGLDLLDQAITRDPMYAVAMAWAASFRAVRVLLSWSDNPDEDRRIALDYRARALRSAPDDPDVLPHAALAAQLTGMDGAVAEAAAERALARNPGSANTWRAIGFMHRYGGKPDAALAAFETCLRLDPRSAWRPIILDGMCGALFSLRRFDEVIVLNRQLWDLLPGLRPHYAPFLASALAHAGRLAEAREMAKNASIESLAAWAGWLDSLTGADRELLSSGFALAQAGTTIIVGGAPASATER